MQDLLNRRRDREAILASGEGAISRSPQHKEKKPKRRHNSTAGTREKTSTKETPTELATVVLDEEDNR